LRSRRIPALLGSAYSAAGNSPELHDKNSFPRFVSSGMPLDKSEGGVKDKSILSVFLAPLFCQRG
jgi:hypothetical protein